MTIKRVKALLDLYRQGYRYLAARHDCDRDYWEPCRTKREAIRWAMDGRREIEAINAGARVEAITDEIIFALQDDVTEADLAEVPIRDLALIARLLAKLTKTKLKGVNLEAITVNQLVNVINS